MGAAPWAILDFSDPDGTPGREIFRDPVSVVATSDLDQVIAALDEVGALAGAGHHLVGFVAYDAAPAFEPRFQIRSGYDGPLVWFAAFREGSVILNEAQDAGPPIAERWESSIDPAGYRSAVERIIEGIESGDFYQVNLTDRYRSTIMNPLAVYERIRFAQRAAYGAFIETGGLQVVSVSPELFLRRSGRVLESRPMKGTSVRGRWPAEDGVLAERLRTSEKDRAENVMIVDLIRNDMGRIAIPGTVEVPSMFTIEKYPTVLQMTSHVKCQLPDSTSLADVLLALFPCGSVTGAPKIAASKSILELEREPRGIYCGAIGVVRPGGDFVFNVAIRTMTVGADRTAVYGAGGGITADSDPTRELEELHAKAAVLTALPQTFGLIETMRLEAGTVHRLSRHLARLEASALYFDFPAVERSLSGLRVRLAAEAARPREGPVRVRIVLNPDGSFDLTTDPYVAAAGVRTMAIAQNPVDSRDRMLFHKTTDRSRYSDRLAGIGQVDDAILINERGEMTETTIGNLVLELDGRLVTPPIGCGLLPGILREELVDAGRIREAILYPRDLRRCTKLWMINSLRGWVEAAVAP
ncbi:MAG: aminodeoxychorismate synthase component I [Gemmatimonadaceae bacterium]